MSLLFHQQESFYATTSRVNCTLQIGDSDEKIRFLSPVKSAQNWFIRNLADLKCDILGDGTIFLAFPFFEAPIELSHHLSRPSRGPCRAGECGR